MAWYGMNDELNYGCRCRCCRSGIFLFLALLAMKVFIFSESVSASRLSWPAVSDWETVSVLSFLPGAGPGAHGLHISIPSSSVTVVFRSCSVRSELAVELLEDLPIASDYNNSSTFIKWKGDTQDPCSRLPIERLMDVLFFLPTTSGQAVRLAFRAVASISLKSSFGRSRFDFADKLCHIRLPQRLQKRARADDLAIDWRRLYYRLHR